MKVSDRSRRQFLRNGTYALGGLLGAGLRSAARLDAQETNPVVLPTFVADTNGDLRLDVADEELVRQVLFSQRGYDLRPLPGFDHRADVFGRGVIDPVAVESVRHTIDGVVFKLAAPLAVIASEMAAAVTLSGASTIAWTSASPNP